MTPAALGFRAHTGWAASIALAGGDDNPVVVDRRRIELCDSPSRAGVYHAARELNLAAAKELVARAVAEASDRARKAIAAVVDEQGEKGRRVVGAGVVLGNAGLPGDLERILASHALVHSAEGALFRNALISGSDACGLAVTGIPSSTLHQDAARALDVEPTVLQRQLVSLGKAAGRPWAQDQKESAVVAWVALRRGAKKR